MKISIINHWSHCNKNAGHAILFGFQYSLWSDYWRYKQTTIELTILGFGFEFKAKPGRDSTEEEDIKRDLKGVINSLGKMEQ